jgi:predicted alpha/beta superfamily hydrolase
MLNTWKTPSRTYVKITSAWVLFCLLFAASAFAQDENGDIVIGKYETLFSKVLNEERTLKIRLPEDYQGSGTGYHVLYLLDAEGDAQYNHAVGTVANASEAEIIPEMIVVGICNTVRRRDMSPVVIPDRPGSGGGKEFLRFITEELIPYIDKEYNTNSRNVLFGGSNAGLFTVFALLEKPDMFIAGVAGSPMIGHCKDYMYGMADNLENKDRYIGKCLYMIYGENDYLRCADYVNEFYDYIKSKDTDGFHSDLVMLEDEGHVPYMCLYNGLKYVFTKIK